MIAFYIILALIGVSAALVVGWMILMAMRQHAYLKTFRWELKRGDVVKVRGYKDKQRIWTNLRNGFVLLSVVDGRFPRVPVTDVYPWNTPPEKWDIAKMEWI